ncbi:transmembrane protein 186-like [Glandiceps talaboti]
MSFARMVLYGLGNGRFHMFRVTLSSQRTPWIKSNTRLFCFQNGLFSKSSGTPTGKNVSTITKAPGKPPASNLSTPAEYTVIYKLPFIRALRSFSRVKLAQTAFTILLLPPLAFMKMEGIISSDTLKYSVYLAVLAMVLLYSMSYFLRRIIGVMAVNNKMDVLRVSHLTFWGRRHNFEVPISDVKPLTEVGDKQIETLRKFQLYSSNQTLYYTLRFGLVTNREKFEAVFGRRG